MVVKVETFCIIDDIGELQDNVNRFLEACYKLDNSKIIDIKFNSLNIHGNQTEYHAMVIYEEKEAGK